MLLRFGSKFRPRRRDDSAEDLRAKQGSKEPEVVIRLTSANQRRVDQVRFSFTTGQFEVVRHDDPLLHLLTLPSRIVPRSVEEPSMGRLLLPLTSAAAALAVAVHLQPSLITATIPDSPVSSEDACGGWRKGEDEDDEGLEEGGGGGVGEEGAGSTTTRADQQPNPFNYSERVSQTTRLAKKNFGIQTAPPPSTTFSRTVGLCVIHHAYRVDYERIMAEEEELQQEQERERERGSSKQKQQQQAPTAPPGEPDPLVIVVAGGGQRLVKEQLGRPSLALPGLLGAARVVERMVAQNTYDQIAQDFRYWEDGSDEFRGLEGSLLPLWKFHHDRSRGLLLADICWSTVYPDLFAAAYAAGDVGGPEGPGMLCLYSLKNPATPEQAFHTPSSVTCVHLHPKFGSVVGAGWADGTVVVYDLRTPDTPLTSAPPSGKHLLPVTQVRWVSGGAGQELSLFSVSVEGKVIRWSLGPTALHPSIVLDLSPSSTHPPRVTPTNSNTMQPSSSSTQTLASNTKIPLKGVATCIAFKPDDAGVVVVGVDSGVVFHCSTACPAHSLLRYPAHSAPVRRVAWNHHHHAVFLSCSVDWMLKIWLQYSLAPLLVVDVGGAVAGAAWSPHSSSVVVAVSEEGRVSVYDLALRRYRPLCCQGLAQRRRVAATCLAFSPFHPVILVGGERGHLVALKLSPNLRRPHKEAKGADPQQLQQLELAKMERIIATANKS